MKTRQKLGLGLLVTGVALGVGATLASLFRRQQREQVYHEAELKAMDELDDMMAEDECAPCTADECEIEAMDRAAEQMTLDPGLSSTEETPAGDPSLEDRLRAEIAEQE